MNYKRFTSALLALSMVLSASAVDFQSTFVSPFSAVSVSALDSVSISESGAGFEAAFVEWNDVSGADGYNVYYRTSSASSYTQLDTQLIRKYSDGWRADAVGLPAGGYTLKVVPVAGGSEDTSKAAETPLLNVSAYDRDGFAHSNMTEGVGAYNNDGSLKDNAVVLYVTEETKNTITMDVATSSSKTQSCTGISEILKALQKGAEKRPVAIRLIGKITADGMTGSGDTNNLLVKSSSASSMASNITVEGIGEDAVCYGFGIRGVRVHSFEIRNVGVMLFGDDGIALQDDNSNVWIHNNDIFYGTAGSDADQAKGDGSMDLKNDSQYITVSYNHFWDSGKMSLCGMKSETGENWITYHHNWFDHSDSRHPRIRTMTVHVFNNYYDGNSKYGVGVTMGASAFVESNYFRNCQYPMLSSKQGTDALGEGTFSGEDGGIIKAYGNYMEGQKGYITYAQDNTQFDAYEVSDKSDTVPSSVKTVSGGTTYNNFDTSSSMYSYTPDDAKDVPSIVMASAGRLNGGDFEWTFDNSVDDTDYGMNEGLMAAVKGYTSNLVSVGGNSVNGTGGEAGEIVTTSASETTKPEETTTEAPATTAPQQTTVPQQTTAPAISSGAIYCSPSGSGDGTSKDSPTSVLNAISTVKAGQTIYLLGGTYKFAETILIDQNNCGSAGAYKTIMAYPGETVVWDFSDQGEANSSVRGVVLDGSYWKFYGFELTKAADNGMLLSGNNNVIEMMVFSDNQDTGLQISRYRTDTDTIAQWPSNNLIKNCTSKNNCDNATMENADGFAAKLTCGEGNVFDGCMAYNNSDDGWDLYAKEATGPIGVVTIKNCIAFRNGYTEFGEGYGDCDGNGFKLGGAGVGTAHIVENCLAFENLNCGFTDNNNPLLESLTNCTAFNNNVGGNGKPNYSLYRCTDDGCDFKNVISYSNDTTNKVPNDKFVGTMENSVYYNSKYRMVTSKVDVTNGYKGGEEVSISDSDFVSVTAPEMGSDFHALWRTASGDINTNGFMQLADSSAYKSMGAALNATGGSAPVIPVETTVTTAVTTTESTTTTKDTTVTTTTETVVTTTPSDSGNDSVATMLGDADCNGIVDLLDLTVLNQHIVKIIQLDGSALANVDVIDDGKVDIADLAQLKKYLIKVIDKF